MKPIRHINQLGTRIREQGRLRMGVKTGNAMKALQHWRFTSPEREPLEQLAVLYGGEVRAWSDPKASQGKDQFELLSKASKVRVFIPPGGLSTWYEAWSGGGVQRRCDGETVFVDGDDQKPQPCLCRQQQRMVCKPKTRLSVVLPEVRPFGGVWRLDTGSWNAADEMAAMEQMLEQLEIQGLVEAQLLIEPRQKMVAGKKKSYVVPVILVGSSAQGALLAGQEGRMLLAGAEQVALPAPSGPEGVSSLTELDDEEPVDAQLVDVPGYDRPAMDARLTVAMDLIVQRHDVTPDQLEIGLARGGSKGSQDDLDALSDSEHRTVLAVAEDIAQGKRRLIGVNDEGRLVLG